MATVIGAASGVLALTIFAFKASKSLYEAVSSFKSKSKDIRDIQTDLGTLVTILGSIRQQAQDSGNESKLEPLRKPIECCIKTCQEMQEMLNACTIHTKDSRNSVRDWLNMRYHEKTFDDFKRQLASYKSTLMVTFDSINMYGSIMCPS
jgi:Fungal N-terminal domain of STAND proteins